MKYILEIQFNIRIIFVYTIECQIQMIHFSISVVYVWTHLNTI